MYHPHFSPASCSTNTERPHLSSVQPTGRVRRSRGRRYHNLAASVKPYAPFSVRGSWPSRISGNCPTEGRARDGARLWIDPSTDLPGWKAAHSSKVSPDIQTLTSPQSSPQSALQPKRLSQHPSLTFHLWIQIFKHDQSAFGLNIVSVPLCSTGTCRSCHSGGMRTSSDGHRDVETDSLKQPTSVNTVGARNALQMWAASFNDHAKDRCVVFKMNDQAGNELSEMLDGAWSTCNMTNDKQNEKANVACHLAAVPSDVALL